jgi:GMP synthase (glutamine-hydrolysing)
MKPFLVIQLRPEDEAADGEYAAFLRKGRLEASDTIRVRLDQGPMPGDISLDEVAGVIVGGGPGCVSDDPASKDPVEARVEAECLALMPGIIERDLPFLGCCYGIGILAHHLRAPVSKERYGEPVGPVACTVTDEGASDPLLDGLPRQFETLVGHKEAVQALPEGAVHLMASDPCPFQMIRYKSNIYATQFHPEADGQVFADRIRIYKDRGYFPPDQAAQLTDHVLSSDVTQPERILRRFIARYR